MKCGWASRTRSSQAASSSGKQPPTKVQPRDDVSPMEIQKILAEAAERSLINMKSRQNQDLDQGLDGNK